MSSINIPLPYGSHLHSSQVVFVEDRAMPDIPQIYGTSMDTYIQAFAAWPRVLLGK